MGRWIPLLRGASLGLLLAVLAGSAWAGDPDLAKFLLQHGRTAISKGEYADAITKLQKARTEDPTLIEATYWLGVANERAKNKRKAIEEYRRFQSLAESDQRKGVLSKTLGTLLKKTLTRLKSLDAANTDINKAQTEFADRLHQSARVLAVSDANLAWRVLQVARRAAPDHIEVRNLMEELERGFVPMPAAFDPVNEWEDLIHSGRFGNNSGWTYEERKRITILASGGGIALPPSGFDSGRDYAYTADITLKDIPSASGTMAIGLVFGLGENEGFSATFWHGDGKPDRLGLAAVRLKPRKELMLKALDIGSFPPGATHRLSVLVVGSRVRVFLDNKPVIDHKVQGCKEIPGRIGLMHQNAHFVLDQLRFGKVEGGVK